MLKIMLTAVLTAVLTATAIGGAGIAFASSAVGKFGGPPWAMAGGLGGPGFGTHLPPELQGLEDIPREQRFQHFKGAEIRLTDERNQPVSATITPGVINQASSSSVTITTNDGPSKTYSITAQTRMHYRGNVNQLQAGHKVVVVTLNGSTEARAILDAGTEGFGPRWHRG
ncbi:MAG: hypothetical protein HY329_26800 [Chloroflexi bacterium]|nr:hypothetical protein [Chloroflexota bacterium]